jgi:UDP-MurNAc hydroxylase
MKFQILSHAGLSVSADGVQLLCDPWVVGSTYWRSWWNYPPPDRELIRSLRPDYVYLTHVHWDHFQGVSLRRFGTDVTVLIPDGHDSRMREDLNAMGFEKVIELEHGQTLQLAPDFRVTCYQFGFLPTDSAVVMESGGTTLLNSNDAKFMGWPLRQILDRHPNIDFVFRSHSSANSRLCYEIVDRPEEPVDDLEEYIQSFAAFAVACGARYAIPFASNTCHLHRDVFHYNTATQTPAMVEDHFRAHGIESPRAVAMVSGDSWDADGGFDIREQDWFERREEHLLEYQKRMAPKLEAFYQKEERSKLPDRVVQRYFGEFFAALPFPLRWLYRGQPILLVCTAGEAQTLYEIDIYRQTAVQLERYEDADYPMQLHTSTLVMRHCLASKLFAHLPISKRVRYRTTAAQVRKLKLFNRLINLFEYRVFAALHLPLRKKWRIVRLRWREIALALVVAKDIALGRGFSLQRYLPARKPAG